MYKSCPFCGDSNAICEPHHDESYVLCQSCKAEGPIGDFDTAGKLWNERAMLTKDQAIKRIRDIKALKSVHHIYNQDLGGGAHQLGSRMMASMNIIKLNAAASELMAIFDIKEEEL